jgi:hypothetical protein
MPRRIMLSAFVIALATIPALAADLPVHSRLGAVFAEPVVTPHYAQPAVNGPVWTYAPQVDIQPLVTGYYGKPNSYYYAPYYGGSYYGGPYSDWGWRLPYACGWYGYC